MATIRMFYSNAEAVPAGQPVRVFVTDLGRVRTNDGDPTYRPHGEWRNVLPEDTRLCATCHDCYLFEALTPGPIGYCPVCLTKWRPCPVCNRADVHPQHSDEAWTALGGTGRPTSGYYSRDYWMSEAQS